MDNNINDNRSESENDPDIFYEEKQQFSLRNITPGINPTLAAFIGLFGGFFLYQIIGGTITVLIIGTDMESAPKNTVRLLTIAGQLIFIFIPALFFAKVFYNDIINIIRVRIPKLGGVLLFILGIIILTPLLQFYLHIQNYYFELLASQFEFIRSLQIILEKHQALVEKTYINLMSADSAVEGAFIIFMIAFVPALCEEVMFRGYIQRSFEFKMKPFWAAFITAVFFGVFHLNPFGLIPLIVLGLYFGFSAYISNSIAVPMILHFLNNFVAVIVFFMIGSDELINTKVQPETDITQTFIMFFLLSALFAGIIMAIRKYYSNLKNT
jgi:uncharacterized protein